MSSQLSVETHCMSIWAKMLKNSQKMNALHLNHVLDLGKNYDFLYFLKYISFQPEFKKLQTVISVSISKHGSSTAGVPSIT